MTREHYLSCNLCDALVHGDSILLLEWNHTGKYWWRSEDDNIHLCPRCQAITHKALAIDEFAVCMGYTDNLARTKVKVHEGDNDD